MYNYSISTGIEMTFRILTVIMVVRYTYHSSMIVLEYLGGIINNDVAFFV